MIIAIYDNKVIAKAEDQATLTAISPTGTEIVDLSALDAMTGTELARIHNIVTGGALDRARDKARVAHIIREEIDKMENQTTEQTKKDDEKAKKAAEKAEAKAKKDAEKAEKATEETGYKGHRAGSMKASAHQIFDEMTPAGKERKEIIAAIHALGTTEATAASWYSSFK